jgi:hypothetical protein
MVKESLPTRLNLVNDVTEMTNKDSSTGLVPATEAATSSAIETTTVPGAAPGKQLSPEAIRALEEAEARRQAATRQELPTEIGGRDGEEPTRYGDWEKKGLAVDF